MGQGKVSGLQHRILVRSQVWYVRKSIFGGGPPSIPALKSKSGVVQSSLKRRTWLLSAHGVTGFAQLSSIYSQNYHPVTDAWESVPIASYLSFCTKGIPARSCRIHCFKKRRKTFSLGRRCPSGRMRGKKKCFCLALNHRLRRSLFSRRGMIVLDDGFCDFAIRLHAEWHGGELLRREKVSGLEKPN